MSLIIARLASFQSRLDLETVLQTCPKLLDSSNILILGPLCGSILSSSSSECRKAALLWISSLLQSSDGNLQSLGRAIVITLVNQEIPENEIFCALYPDLVLDLDEVLALPIPQMKSVRELGCVTHVSDVVNLDLPAINP